MKDYEVNTAVLFHTGFADGECNRLMFEGMKEKIVNDIRSAFEKDSTLSQNITSNLDFTFSGYKVKVEYTFSCHDENEAEAESFSNYCLQNIREGLQEKGYTMEKVTCEASKMDIDTTFREADTMMHYERVRTDLSQAEKTIKTALRSTVDSETEKAALEEALELVQQAKEKCRMVQEESMQALFTRGMKMQ